MTGTTELALVESRSLRDQYIDRTDVLDKVKALRTLSDGYHVTTEMVAAYYEVPVETIKSVVEDNGDELAANGRQVIKGDELREFASPFGGPAKLGLSPKTRTLALFSRRAVLNVGQLLRDSIVARDVRTMLLDVEQGARTLPSRALPQDYSEALRALADECDAHDVTRQRLALTLPLAEAYSDLMSKDGTFDWAATAQIFMSITGGLGRNTFLELLRDLKILKANNTPYQKGGTARHFRVTGDPEAMSAVTTVKPSGLDWLRQRLIKHFHHQPALFDTAPPRLRAIDGSRP